MITQIFTAIAAALFGWLDQWITRWRAEQARVRADEMAVALQSMKEKEGFEGKVDQMNKRYEAERARQAALEEKLEYLRQFNGKK